MQQYTTPFKAHSVPFKANGVFYGVVVAVNDKRLDIKVPRMTGDAVFKNIEYADSAVSDTPSAGELLLVSFLEGNKDDLVVLGRVKSSLDRPDVDLTGAVAGDFLQYDGTKFIAADIDLGSLTVGNYVATIAGTANEIDVSGSGVEGAAVTLSLPATINADTTGSAAKWTNSRTITLGGDLTGSVSFDGSANATLTATVAADSVALGTDTTGNYVATITAGTGLTFSAGSGTGEGSTPTIAVDSVQLGTNTTGDYVATLTAGTNLSISAGSGTGEGSTPTLSTSTTPSFSTITSTVATGTSPFTVASTTLVSNLNADLLDGQHASFYMPSGSIQQYAGLSAPTGWLLCAGQTLSRSTYADLFAAVTLDRGAVTSISNANPCVVTYTSHGLVAGDAVYFTTSGSLPSGLTANTTYYVQNPAANTFNLNTSQANAIANSATGRIATTTAGSGTHNLIQAPWGGITSLLFAIPDLRGRVGVGMDNMGGSDASRLSLQNAIGLGGGAETHTLSTAEMPVHTHTAGSYDGTNGINNNLVTDGGGGNAYQALIASGSPNSRIGTNSAGGSGGVTSAHNNMQPYVLLNYIIKT